MFRGPGNSKRLSKIFLSSPFSEPRGQPWQVRRKLYDSLRSLGFRPWSWEEDGERAKARLAWSDADILVQALRQCDIVVAFFRNRAGSYLPAEAFSRTPIEPFHATVFEIFHARNLGKPIHLYIVGNHYKASLSSILSLITNPLLITDYVKVVEDEEYLEEAVVANFLQLRAVDAPPKQYLAVPDLDMNSLEARLRSFQSAKTLWEAKPLADQIPLVNGARLADRTKRLYAELLAKSANVFANQTAYNQAISAATLSVRYFIELGSWPEMYSQVQALSGILNMAGRPDAERVHHFGLIPAMRSYPNLLPSYFDSAGSILMRSGRWRSARKWLKKVAEADPSPYSQSKSAIAVAGSGELSDIGEASQILYSVALPNARRSGQSLAYTLRHAAALAIAQSETKMARGFLSEASAECLRTGTLHTLQNIRKLNTLLDLLSPDEEVSASTSKANGK
jgi:tetratricopeptide (TPR) repeat protein